MSNYSHYQNQNRNKKGQKGKVHEFMHKPARATCYRRSFFLVTVRYQLACRLALHCLLFQVSTGPGKETAKVINTILKQIKQVVRLLQGSRPAAARTLWHVKPLLFPFPVLEDSRQHSVKKCLSPGPHVRNPDEVYWGRKATVFPLRL